MQAASGRPLWKMQVARFTESTPAVDGGVVYTADSAGTARAVEAKTGKIAWSTDLAQEFLGCPVVTTDRGSAREYLGEHAYYCDPADPASIRDAVSGSCASRSAPAAAPPRAISRFPVPFANIPKARSAPISPSFGLEDWSPAVKA